MNELGAFFDRAGKQITRPEWRELRDTPSYRFVRRYKRKDGYWAEVVWDGHGLKPYRLLAEGIEQGTRTEKEAIDLYEHTLVAAGHAEWIGSPSEPGRPHFVAPENLYENVTTKAADVQAFVDNQNFGTW